MGATLGFLWLPAMTAAADVVVVEGEP